MSISDCVRVALLAVIVAGAAVTTARADKSDDVDVKTGDTTSVRAPFTAVDVKNNDRTVRVDAPFTGVRVDRDRVRVRAPFVDLDIRR